MKPGLRPQRLAVLTTYYNPCRYRNIRRNYERFAEGMIGLDLWTAEMALDRDRYQLPAGPRMVRVRGTRERNLMWQKERLINLLIQRLPAEYDAAAWVDCDFLFRDPTWADQALDALASWPAVQLYSHLDYQGPDGEVYETRPAMVWKRTHCPSGPWGCPGGAWAAKREVADAGLYEHNLVGGGDCALLDAWTGRDRLSVAPRDSAWDQHWRQWATSRYALVRNALGYLPGRCVHLYHGTRHNRKYSARNRYQADYGFNPAADVEADANGLLAWTWHALARKPEMVRLVGGYFEERREDD